MRPLATLSPLLNKLDRAAQLAFGGADNRARVIDANEGKLIMRFDAHSGNTWACLALRKVAT
jgi:hypothetical protein